MRQKVVLSINLDLGRNLEVASFHLECEWHRAGDQKRITARQGVVSGRLRGDGGERWKCGLSWRWPSNGRRVNKPAESSSELCASVARRMAHEYGGRMSYCMLPRTLGKEWVRSDQGLMSADPAGMGNSHARITCSTESTIPAPAESPQSTIDDGATGA